MADGFLHHYLRPFPITVLLANAWEAELFPSDYNMPEDAARSDFFLLFDESPFLVDPIDDHVLLRLHRLDVPQG